MNTQPTTTGRLDGKRALVTAAGQGIGRASALLFASEGAQVFATDIDRVKLGGMADELRIEAMRLDVTDPTSIEQIADSIGPVDVLFNCAGIVPEGSIVDCTEAEWATAFDLNVRSMFRLIRQFLPAMVARGTGSIINMASVASSIRGVPNRFVYSATKAAVIGLTKSVAVDFAAMGVRCNAICPGTVDTPSLDARIAAAADPDSARQAFVARQPMQRLGKAKEIAALALYLASAESAYTTGAVHVIDGGWSN